MGCLFRSGAGQRGSPYSSFRSLATQRTLARATRTEKERRAPPAANSVNFAAADASARVAGRLPAVVLLLVNDDGATEERIRVAVFEVCARRDDVEVAVAAAVDRDVAEIAQVVRV